MLAAFVFVLLVPNLFSSGMTLRKRFGVPLEPGQLSCARTRFDVESEGLNCLPKRRVNRTRYVGMQPTMIPTLNSTTERIAPLVSFPVANLR